MDECFSFNHTNIQSFIFDKLVPAHRVGNKDCLLKSYVVQIELVKISVIRGKY